jgi:hypothetical protein
VSDQEPRPEPAGAERADNPWFARRAWVLGVVITLAVLGTYLAGIVGLLVAALLGGLFLLVAKR